MVAKRSSVGKRSGRTALPERVELAIAGGGLAGLVCAWVAARAGVEVVVIDDRSRPPAAAVAAGMIAPVGEAIWGEEGQLAAALSAADAWPAFALELEAAAGLEVPYRRCGSLHIALDRDEAAELERRHGLHRRLDLDARALLPSRCRELEPGLGTAVRYAVEAPGEAEVDPRALLAALAAAADREGARRFEGRVRGVDTETGRVEVEGAGSVRAERVVLTAGAWAGEAGLKPWRPLPIRPVKGEILRLRADPASLPCERILVGERFYLVPRPDGEVVLGATVEERGFDLSVSAGGVHELLRESYRALPELAELEFLEAAAGLRPGTPDNAPIIGRLGGGSTFLVGGLYRHGVLLAPLIATAVAALLAGRSLPEELRGLGPDRFVGTPAAVS